MSDQAEQNILRAIAELKGDISRLDQRVQSLDQKVQALEAKLESEVRRWDERFFKFAADSNNRALTLITSATIAVIAGVILSLVKS
jgi:hypothetical protein